MFDLAKRDAEASVHLVTSTDDDHRPENIIDGNPETYWISTGLFPQEFVVSFPQSMDVNTVTISCCDVKRLALEGTDEGDPLKFRHILDNDLEACETGVQRVEMKVNQKMRHLKVVVKDAYDHFVAVQNVAVMGQPVN